MLLRETVLLSLTLCCLCPHPLQADTYVYAMKAWEETHIKTHCFVLPREIYPGSSPQSPSLHAAARCRLLPQKRRQEPCQFIPAPSEQSTGWGSTLGAVLPEEYPSTKPLPGWDIRIWYPRWILHEITVTLTWLALVGEKEPSTRAFLTAEPSVSTPWNRQQKPDLRTKGEIAAARALCHHFLNFLLAARVRKF